MRKAQDIELAIEIQHKLSNLQDIYEFIDIETVSTFELITIKALIEDAIEEVERHTNFSKFTFQGEQNELQR